MYSPKRHTLFGPILRGRRMSALFLVWTTVRARGRRVSFVYLTSPLICWRRQVCFSFVVSVFRLICWRRQAFLSFVWSVSCLVFGRRQGFHVDFLLSPVYRRRQQLSFICWFPGEGDLTHIILYNMPSPLVRPIIYQKGRGCHFFHLWRIFFEKK